MFYLWLAIVILLTIVEFLTVNLTTIWFVISAILSMLLSFVVDNFFLQFSVFVIVGIVLLITTRPILQKWLSKNKEKTNIDRIIGMRGIVTEEILKNSIGEVKVDGKRWSAYADEKIKVNAIVKILEINGVKLKVEEEGE